MRPVCWPVVERALARALPDRCLAPALGDLIEDYERQRATRGLLRAEMWLVRECLSLRRAYLLARLRLHAPRRPAMDVLRSDLVYGWRAIRARPAATLATVAVLTLGIGLVSAMFALADPYLLRPLPFARADELYGLSLRTRSQADVPTLADWTARTELFAGVAAQGSAQAVPVGSDDAESTLRLLPVSQHYFAVLGVPFAMPADWRPVGDAAETPVILTADAAARLFGRVTPNGQSLRHAQSSRSFRVVATLTAPFVDPFARPGTTIDGFVPLGDGPLLSIQTNGGAYSSSGPSVLARLQSGVTPDIVEDALSTATGPNRNMMPLSGAGVVADSVVERLTSRVRPLALSALAAGLLILIVCAANVANLLLVRGASRTREFASREALGASRSAIARLVLMELGLLTSLGIIGGLVLARLALLAAALVIPAEYTTLGTPAVTMRVVGLACGAGMLVMLAGMVPGWAAWRVTPLALFNQIASGETIRIRVLRFSMTVAQTAIAVILLVGAVLFGRSYVNLVTQDPGYDGDTFAIAATYGQGVQVGVDMMDAVLARLRRVPGVTHVAAFSGSLVDGSISMGFGGMTIDGQRVPGFPQFASIEFFEALGSSVVAGRSWTAADNGRTAIVTESFAAECCDGRTPVGRMLAVGTRAFEVVGVVKDLYTRALDHKPGPAVFLSFEGREDARSTVGWVRINYVIRSQTPDAGLVLTAEREIRAADAGVTTTGGASMRERLMQSINDRSFATLIVTFFGVAAIGVSAAGVVGVVGFIVARRTREIAIRLAVGATASDVCRLVTREAGIAAAVGAVAGLVMARWASKALESLLYGIEPADPWSFGIAALALVLVVVAAAWVPARRASRLSPTIALRAE